MQHRLLCLIALTAAGCAPMRPATEFSDWDICRFTMRGGNEAVIAQNEASRRNLDCRTLYPAIIAREQAQAAQVNATANILRGMQPVPPPMQAPIDCTSIRSGSVVNTTCR